MSDEYIRRLERDRSLGQNERNLLIYNTKLRAGYPMNWREFSWLPDDVADGQVWDPQAEAADWVSDVTFNLGHDFVVTRTASQSGDLEADSLIWFTLSRKRFSPLAYSTIEQLYYSLNKGWDRDLSWSLGNGGHAHHRLYPQIPAEVPRYQSYARYNWLRSNIINFEGRFIFEALGLIKNLI